MAADEVDSSIRPYLFLSPPRRGCTARFRQRGSEATLLRSSLFLAIKRTDRFFASVKLR